MKHPSSKAVRKARLASGLTQEQAATLIGYARRTWQDWESGTRKMRPAVWERFQQHLYTCKACGGKMLPGKAIEQTWVGTPEWAGDPICTMSAGGPGKLIACLKCVNCGRSITAPDLQRKR